MSGREIAGDESDGDEKGGCGGHDGSVVELHPGPGRPEKPGDAESAEHADGGSSDGQPYAGTEDHPNDVAGAGAQREANGEFAGALAHRAGDDAVYPEGGEREA